MIRRSFITTIGFAVTLAACRGRSPDDAGTDSALTQAVEDEAMTPSDVGGLDALAIRQLQREIVDAANALDLEGLMSYFHPEVIYLVPSRPPLEGWEAVRDYYDSLHRRFVETGQYLYLEAVTHQVVVVGDWAWAWGETHAVMAPLGQRPVISPDAQPGSKHLSIYKREDGKWLRYRQIRNGNTPEMNI